MEKFTFNGVETRYNFYWLDENTFCFDFGDGEFIDENGDDFFFHCEDHMDSNKFLFEMYYDFDNMVADESHISDYNKKYVKQFMKDLIKK